MAGETVELIFLAGGKLRDIGKNQRRAPKRGERSRSDDLEFAVRLEQEQDSAAEGRQEMRGVVIARSGRKIDADGMDWSARVVQSFLVTLNPEENFGAGWGVIRTGHGVAGRIPKIDAGHDLRGRESFHGFARVDSLVAVPGIVE